jgi:hypothetical protein
MREPLNQRDIRVSIGTACLGLLVIRRGINFTSAVTIVHTMSSYVSLNTPETVDQQR